MCIVLCCPAHAIMLHILSIDVSLGQNSNNKGNGKKSLACKSGKRVKCIGLDRYQAGRVGT